MRTIVYDFDKTLTRSDTLLGFFRLAAKRQGGRRIHLGIYFLGMVATKLGWMSNTRLKAIGVDLFLRGMACEVLESLCLEYAAQIACNGLYHRMQKHREARIFVVTASFEAYLVPLFSDEVIVIGSRISCVDGSVDALAYNCYGDEKVKTLQAQGVDRIDLLYTDSWSDRALAEISRKIIVVDGEKLTVCETFEAFREYFGK